MDAGGHDLLHRVAADLLIEGDDHLSGSGIHNLLGGYPAQKPVS